MTTDEIVDTTIEQLERASQESAAGRQSLEHFQEFLTNFETLATLHESQEANVAKLMKREHICYNIASDQIDRQVAAEVLPRIQRLIASEIFPRETDFVVLCNWLGQISLLFEIAEMADDGDGYDTSEALDQSLTMSSQLIGFCSDRLKYEKINQTSLNWPAFEKTCHIAKRGVSREFGLEINLKAVELIEKFARLVKDPQFAATSTQDQFGLISGKLWSIVKEDLKFILTNNFAYNNKMNQNGHETRRALNEKIVKLVELLPQDDEALEHFYAKLRETSRPESDAADLTILDSILEARKHEAKGVWPILDIHMSRGDPIIREACLCMAIDRFGKESVNMDELKAMLKHLDLIIDEVTGDQYDEENRGTQLFKLIALLYSIPGRDDSAKNEIRPRLKKLLEATSVELLKDAIANPEMINVRGKYEYTVNANLFRDAAMDKLEQVYLSGVKAEGRIDDLKALYKMATTDGNCQTSYERKYVDIVAAGCDGLVPDGCDEKMFSFLKKAKTVAGDEDESCLLTIARMVYDREYPSAA